MNTSSSTPRSRRDFLAGLSTGLAALHLSGSAVTMAQAPATPEPRTGGRKLGVALVGLGGLSANQIAPALAKTKHCRLAGLVSGTPAKLASWRAKYGVPEKNCYNYETFDQIADNPDIDIVYIVLPNSMHAEYTIRAAKARKHVLCEKPMATSARECEQMITACRQANRQLAIGYRCQFEPHHQEAIRLSREKIFGTVKWVEASFGFRIGDPTQWRLRKALAGGGALMDVGIYALQAARYIAGEEPAEVSAFETKTDREKFREVDESIAWTLRFPSGLVASCGTTYGINGMNRLWVGAENGWYSVDPAYGYGGQAMHTSKGDLDYPVVDQFAAEMDDFALCLLTNKRTRVPGEEGLRDLKVIEAIYESIKTGKSIQLR